MNRVVITGMKALTSIGNDVSSTLGSMINGKHGIAPITHFDTEKYDAKPAAEVKNYVPTLYLNEKEIQRYDVFTVLGVGAASQAMTDSDIVGKISPEQMGLYFSTGIGELITLGKMKHSL